MHLFGIGLVRFGVWDWAGDWKQVVMELTLGWEYLFERHPPLIVSTTSYVQCHAAFGGDQPSF